MIAAHDPAVAVPRRKVIAPVAAELLSGQDGFLRQRLPGQRLGLDTELAMRRQGPRLELG